MSETKAVMQERLEGEIKKLQEQLASANPDFAELIAENEQLNKNIGSYVFVVDNIEGYCNGTDVTLSSETQTAFPGVVKTINKFKKKVNVLTEKLDSADFLIESQKKLIADKDAAFADLDEKYQARSDDMVNTELFLDKGIEALDHAVLPDGCFTLHIIKLMRAKERDVENAKTDGAVENVQGDLLDESSSVWADVDKTADEFGVVQSIALGAEERIGIMVRFKSVDGTISAPQVMSNMRQKRIGENTVVLQSVG